MLDRPSLAKRIIAAELAVAQCDQRIHELTHELRPSAMRSVHAHGKVIAVSAVAMVVAGVLIYPRRAAIMGSQLGHTVWNMALSMGMPWLLQKAASHAHHEQHADQASEPVPVQTGP